MFVKSSHSFSNSNCVEIDLEAAWAKSGHSESVNCAEVRAAGGTVLVRDSKDKSGPVLAFTPAEWEAFTGWLKAG